MVNLGGTATAQFLTVDSRTIVGDVTGVLFRDFDENGLRDPGETAIVGWTVYGDRNGNGARDAGEQFVVTDAKGRYLLDGLPTGDVTIRTELPGGWEHWTGGVVDTTVVAQSRTGGIDLAVTGGATPGDDRIDAGRDTNDVIAALRGDDRVLAHNGDDRIDGGVGADVFVVDGAGRHRIADFGAGDHIQVSAGGVHAFADLTITAHGDGSVISWAGADAAVFVRAVMPDALDASAIVFG